MNNTETTERENELSYQLENLNDLVLTIKKYNVHQNECLNFLNELLNIEDGVFENVVNNDRLFDDFYNNIEAGNIKREDLQSDISELIRANYNNDWTYIEDFKTLETILDILTEELKDISKEWLEL